VPHVMEVALLARDAGLKVEKAGHISSFSLESTIGSVQIYVTKEQYAAGIVPKEVKDILFSRLDVDGRSGREILYRKCLLGDARLKNPSALEKLLVDSSLAVPEIIICVEDDAKHFGEFCVIDAAKNINDAVKDYGNTNWLVKNKNYLLGRKGKKYVLVIRAVTAGEYAAIKIDFGKKLFMFDYQQAKGFGCGSFKFGERVHMAVDERKKRVADAVGILKTYLKVKGIVV